MKKALVCIGSKSDIENEISFCVGRLVKENLKDWHIFFVDDEPEDKFKALKELKPDLIFAIDVLSGLSYDKPLFFDLSNDSHYMHLRHKLPNAPLLSYFRNICPKTLFLGIKVLLDDVIDSKISQRTKDDIKIAYEKVIQINNMTKEKQC